MKERALYKIAQHGRFIWRLGRSSWPLDEAMAIAEDLRRRGYADAHVQLCIPEQPLRPFALTLVAKGGPP